MYPGRAVFTALRWEGQKMSETEKAKVLAHCESHCQHLGFSQYGLPLPSRYNAVEQSISCDFKHVK